MRASEQQKTSKAMKSSLIYVKKSTVVEELEQEVIGLKDERSRLRDQVLIQKREIEQHKSEKDVLTLKCRNLEEQLRQQRAEFARVLLYIKSRNISLPDMSHSYMTTKLSDLEIKSTATDRSTNNNNGRDPVYYLCAGPHNHQSNGQLSTTARSKYLSKKSLQEPLDYKHSLYFQASPPNPNNGHEAKSKSSNSQQGQNLTNRSSEHEKTLNSNLVESGVVRNNVRRKTSGCDYRIESSNNTNSYLGSSNTATGDLSMSQHNRDSRSTVTVADRKVLKTLKQMKQGDNRQEIAEKIAGGVSSSGTEEVPNKKRISYFDKLKNQ